jgi:hypothetical protein
LRRFVLVGQDDYLSGDPAAVVKANGRFRLVDLSRGNATVVIAASNFSFAEHTPGRVAHWMADDGELAVLRSNPGAGKLVLQAAALDLIAPLPITANVDGQPVGAFVAQQDAASYTIDLPPSSITRVVLHNAKPARPSGEDRRHLSLYLTSARA